MAPELVAEFIADTSVDAGRYRHPVRYLRVRDDLTPDLTPPFDAFTALRGGPPCRRTSW
ncbi:hypothetical protein AB0N50_36580 [Streptomyces pharetrae]|uniref:hypothetical protein n=1 Tax=Streptomyces pharetrae TaxID=291370 RepID=UPI0034616598